MTLQWRAGKHTLSAGTRARAHIGPRTHSVWRALAHWQMARAVTQTRPGGGVTRHRGTHHCRISFCSSVHSSHCGRLPGPGAWRRPDRGIDQSRFQGPPLKSYIPLCVCLTRVCPALLLRVSLVYPPRRTRPLRGTLCCSEDKHLLCLTLGWLRRRFGKPANRNRKAQFRGVTPTGHADSTRSAFSPSVCGLAGPVQTAASPVGRR